MREYFPDVKRIRYEGAETKNPLAFRHYNAEEVVLGKRMSEHLRFSVCYWHTFKHLGGDPFGAGTMIREYNASPDAMEVAEKTMEAAFEFFSKL